MAKKTKVGLKVPTKNEILKKYGSIMRLASDTVESNLWLPSTILESMLSAQSIAAIESITKSIGSFLVN